jgi:hypothetical protein
VRGTNNSKASPKNLRLLRNVMGTPFEVCRGAIEHRAAVSFLLQKMIANRLPPPAARAERGDSMRGTSRTGT